MDHKLMQVYLDEVWHPFIKRRAEELGLPAKSLFVMDSFSAHLTDDVTENFQKNNCTLAIIPGGCTSKVQPLDVSINKPFKQILKTKWSHYMKSKVDTLDSQALTAKAKIPTVMKQELVQWIATAWEILSEQKDLIKKSFTATGVIAAGDRVKADLVMSKAYEKAVQDLMEELNTEAVESEDQDPFAQFDDEEPDSD